MTEVLDNKQLTEKLGALTEFINDKTDLDFNNMAPASIPKATLAGYAMPSSKYDNLTLGSSGTTYTAPANGYFYFSARSKGTAKLIFIQLYNNTSNINSMASNYLPNTSAQYTVLSYIPVKKGDIVTLYYDLASTVDTEIARFIYAEGEV